MAVVLTCVVVSVALWVLLWVSVCVLAGALKFPCVSYHYLSAVFIHLVVCLTIGTQPIPNPVLHTVRSYAPSFNFQHPVFPLRSSSNCLRLLPRVPVTSLLPSVFPSLPCFRRQFLHKVWPIPSDFLLCTIYRYSCSPLIQKNINTFAASYLNTQELNNSCLKSPASTLVDLTFQSRALRSFSLNHLRNLSL